MQPEKSGTCPGRTRKIALTADSFARQTELFHITGQLNIRKLRKLVFQAFCVNK